MRKKRKRLHRAAASESVVNSKSYLESNIHLNNKRAWSGNCHRAVAILLCTAFAQAQEVFVTADFVSSYIWRGIESGNASVQPSLGLNWKGLTVFAWGSTEFREKNNEIDLSLEY